MTMTPSPATPPAAAAGARLETRPVVLVAEDEESVRTMIALALRACGFDAVLCADGLAAAEVIEGGAHVDAVLVDLRMPRLGGLELVERLRGRPESQRLPVVAMSAYSDEAQAREARAAGADAFLAKPFRIAELAATLRGVLER